jgi:hypothetical protein
MSVIMNPPPRGGPGPIGLLHLGKKCYLISELIKSKLLDAASEYTARTSTKENVAKTLALS